jgi:hypothetical protein
MSGNKYEEDHSPKMTEKRNPLGRHRIDRLSDEAIKAELERVAKHFGYRKFSRHEFDSVSDQCKGSVVIDRFGSWKSALDQLGVDLKPHRNTRRDQIPKADLLKELGRVWSNLGHRPSKTEWDASDTRYSYTTYKTRFGGWLNACGEYVEFSDDDIPYEAPSDIDRSVKIDRSTEILQENKRNIPLKLRLNVFQRDNFRCIYCGKSPATNHGVTLHVDHITAFSKGGETVIDNLQTLCNECNWGKGGD